jgi:hypothetical protein
MTSHRQNYFYNKSIAIQKWFAKPSRNGAFILIILLGNLYGIGLGATFWVDSEAYILISRIFASKQAAQQFITSSHSLVFSHVLWGEAGLWYGLSQLPTEFIWPALAIIQHGFAMISQYIVFRALNNAWPSRMHLLFCIGMSFFPFYQSMHNALMTESLSASFLLLAFGVSINMLEGFGNRNMNFALMALSIFIAVQFRYAFLVFGASLFLILFVFKVISFRRLVVAACIVGFAMAVYPIYMYMQTSTFRMPSVTIWKINMATYTFQETPSAVIDYAKTLDLPDTKYIDKFVSSFSKQDVYALADYWLSRGYTVAEISRIANHIFSLYETQQTRYYYASNLTLSLTVMGMTVPFSLLPKDVMVYRDFNPKAMGNHQLSHYSYLSWIKPMKEEYESLTQHFFLMEKDATKEKELFLNAWKPYVNFSSGYALRDPLKLGTLRPDVFALAGIVGIIFLAKRREKVSWLFFVSLAMTTLLFFIFKSGAIRYAYPSLLIHILSTSICCSILIRGSSSRVKYVQQSSRRLAKIRSMCI